MVDGEVGLRRLRCRALRSRLAFEMQLGWRSDIHEARKPLGEVRPGLGVRFLNVASMQAVGRAGIYTVRAGTGTEGT